jgi:hypothetical protein
MVAHRLGTWARAFLAMPVVSDPTGFEFEARVSHKTKRDATLAGKSLNLDEISCHLVSSRVGSRRVELQSDATLTALKHFYASLPHQFDELVWFDETHAVEPLRSAPRQSADLPETYLFGL